MSQKQKIRSQVQQDERMEMCVYVIDLRSAMVNAVFILGPPKMFIRLSIYAKFLV